MTVPVVQALQRETLDVLRDCLGGAGKVALLDVPDHDNAGDALIYLGTSAYLSKLGIDIRYACAAVSYSAQLLEKLHPSGPILLQGGGNFGDLWPGYQEFREQVLHDFPNRRIIMLPQSMHFESADRQALAVGRMKKHESLIVLLRDRRGVLAASDELLDIDVRYCPDLAAGVGSLRARNSPQGIVYLKRTDKESTGRVLDSVDDLIVADWTMPPRSSFLASRLARRMAKRCPSERVANWLERKALDQRNRVRVDRAVDVLCQGQVVVADRMHAMFMGLLMGRPTIGLDNSYGKVSACFNDFNFDRAGNMFLAEDPRKALALARQLAGLIEHR